MAVIARDAREPDRNAVPQQAFEQVVEAATPIIESVEFPTP
jgi:hypothetical protein